MKMIGNTGTLMTMRIVRSKLRKREESSTNAAANVTIEPQQQQRHGHYYGRNSTNIYQHENQSLQIFTSVNDSNDNTQSNNNIMEIKTITFTRANGACSPSNVWVFPPKAPSPHIHNCVRDDAIAMVGEENGFKCLKKQFSGRFKRLVSNKKDGTSPIPPELKPQLKSIYVY